MRRPLLSSRVTTIRWLGVGQLFVSILIFLIAVAIFAVDFAEVKIAETSGNGIPLTERDGDGSTVTTREWSFPPWLILVLINVLVGMLAGIPAAAMSRYEGLTHNISLKNQVLVNSVGNGFASIFYMVFAGTDFLENVDKLKVFDFNDDEFRASYALFIVIFVFAFFNMVVAFSTVIAASLWTPREQASAPEKQGNGYIVEEPYVREERVRQPAYDYYRQDRRYGEPTSYYGPGYRTLPALKYY